MLAETINARIKFTRKELGYNQSNFAKMLGIGQTSISFIEKDGSTVTEQNIKAISNLFNVNEEWLRTGQGNKFIEQKDNVLNQVTDLLKLDETEQSFLNAYLNLSYEQRQNFKESIRNFVASYNNLENTEIAATITARPVRNDKKLTKAEKIALMHKQLDEEEKAQTSSASTIISGFGGEKMA